MSYHQLDWSFNMTWHYSYTTTTGNIIRIKRAICPKCGWVARFVREECDDEGCWEVYQCTRCLHIFRIKIKK
jgi:DNA-directed RNA polymerase subunit M/transcription elongation factor TFIIS